MDLATVTPLRSRISAPRLSAMRSSAALRVAVDAASGADFHYDSPIFVTLGGPNGQPAMNARVAAAALAASHYPVYLHCEDPAVDAVFVANGAPRAAHRKRARA